MARRIPLLRRGRCSLSLAGRICVARRTPLLRRGRSSLSLAGRISGARIDGKDCTYSSLQGYDRPVIAPPRSATTDVLLRTLFFFDRRLVTRYARNYLASGQPRVISGHAIAYRWRSLPRVHRHRASSP